MRGRRAICVSRDDRVCAAVDAALAAVGVAVEHAAVDAALAAAGVSIEHAADAALAAAGVSIEHAAAAPAEAGVGVEHAAASLADPADAGAILVIADAAARRASSAALCAQSIPVAVVGDDLEDDALISLLLDAPISHLVEDPADRTLAVASHKLASGEVWGLDPYLAPGTPVLTRAIASDLARRRAVDEVCAWAEALGARRATVHRLTSVVGELVMNALVAAAPVGAPHPTDGSGAGVVLSFAADARTLAISVRDDRGALCRRDLVDHIRRARFVRGRPQSPIYGDEPGGAGLGLYLVLANVASLIVNLAAGRRTEVVCLFDRAAPSAPAIARARSLHVFAG